MKLLPLSAFAAITGSRACLKNHYRTPHFAGDFAESLFQTRSIFLSANFTSLYNKSSNKDMKM